MNITSGEPVPPGFEDEVNRVPEIQAAIDLYKGNALIGLEYTIELHEDDRHEPSYFCVLCEKRGDPRTIMQHWTSFNHRMKYLEKHYPTAVREFNPVKYKPNSHNIIISIVQSLSEAIEDHHDRLAIAVCNADDFRHNKSKVINDINAKYHHDEKNGPSFVNIIDRTLWDSKPSTTNKITVSSPKISVKAPKRIASNEKSNNRDGLDEISSDDSDGQDSSKKSKKGEQSPAFRILPRVRRSPPFEPERNGEGEKKLPTPRELSMQASHIAQERYKWEKYRCMLEIQLKQMEKIQQDYDKNPEKHPMYPDEWKKFWNRRYKELQAEKKVDPNKYDYKPEWITFWTKRMKELFNAEVEKKKKEIKLKLELPENAEDKIDQIKEKYKVQVTRSATSAATTASKLVQRVRQDAAKRQSRDRERGKIASDVIDISDDESRHSRSLSPRARRDLKRSRARSNSRSISPFSDDFENSHHSSHPARRHPHHHASHHSRAAYPSTIDSSYYAAPPAPTSSYSRSRYPPTSAGAVGHYSLPHAGHYRVMDSHQYPKYEHSPSPHSKSASIKEEPEPDNGPLTVVAVLRLLTALEEHLGSLGPKVVDLLGKALALEKVKANSADDMLTNDDYCVFFETIKEKLKGLLIAEVIDDPQKVRAVKRAIKNIAAIIHQVDTQGNEKENKENAVAVAGEPDADGGNGNKKKTSIKNNKPNIKDLPFDRQIVATKLAAALVTNGREDVSTDDMDKLIYMFLLMVKLSKPKAEVDGSPLHTSDFLPELGLAIPRAIPNLPSLADLPGIVNDLFENAERNTTAAAAKAGTALSQQIVQEDEISNEPAEKETLSNDANGSMLESLTDSDLQTLLQNFKHLSNEEQHHLINHLKKLETADPTRVEKLRKFVNVSDVADAAPSASTSSMAMSQASTSKGKNHADHLLPSSHGSRSKRLNNVADAADYVDSPTNSGSKDRSHYSDDDNDDDGGNAGAGPGRIGSGNGVERRRIYVNPNKFSLDDEDEDDDYNFEDVFKAASKSIEENTRQSSRNREMLTKSTDSASNSTSAASKAAATEPIIPVASSPNALTFNPAGLNISLSDTQNIIANLMGSLQQSNNNTKSNNNTRSSDEKTPAQQVPTKITVPKQQEPPKPAATTNMSYYQQQHMQQQSYIGGYNQMAAAAAYYNPMGGYNNAAMVGGYPANPAAGYQQWGASNAANMQQFGMQNFVPQQQQTTHQMGGYNNMYGGN